MVISRDDFLRLRTHSLSPRCVSFDELSPARAPSDRLQAPSHQTHVEMRQRVPPSKVEKHEAELEAMTKIVELLKCECKEAHCHAADLMAALDSLQIEFAASKTEQNAELVAMSEYVEKLTAERDEARRVAEALAEKGCLLKEYAVVVQSQKTELTRMSLTVELLKQELKTLCAAGVGRASSAAKSPMPTAIPAQRGVHDQDPESCPVFAERLRLVRTHRADYGAEAQVCMLCPKVVFRDEPYQDCCEYCFHQVLPLLSADTAQTCRQELEMLLGDA